MTVAIDVQNKAVLELLAALEQMKLVRTLSRRERETLAGEVFDDAYPEDVPNLETLAAIQEAEDIISGKVQAKTYQSVNELFDEIEAEITEEEAAEAAKPAAEAIC